MIPRAPKNGPSSIFTMNLNSATSKIDVDPFCPNLANAIKCLRKIHLSTLLDIFDNFFWMFSIVLDCSRLFWTVLNCSGLLSIFLDLSGLLWTVLYFSILFSTILYFSGLFPTVPDCVVLILSILNCSGLFWTLLILSGLCWTVHDWFFFAKFSNRRNRSCTLFFSFYRGPRCKWTPQN